MSVRVESTAAVPTLDNLARDPQLAGTFPPAERSRLAAQCIAALCALSAPAPASDAETTDTASDLVSASTLAKRWELPETWIREQARAGVLPSHKLGHYVRFRLSEVTAWLDEYRDRNNEPLPEEKKRAIRGV